MTASLLPPSVSQPGITSLAQPLTEAMVAAHDTVLVLVDAERAPKVLAQLPFGSMWQHLYTQAREKPTHLAARVANKIHTSMIVGLLRPESGAFDRLTLAGKLWKQLQNSPARKILIAAQGFSDSHRQLAIGALLEAVLAGNAAMPNFKSAANAPSAIAQLEKISICGTYEKSAVDYARATNTGNHLARWLAMLPPNILNSKSYRTVLTQLARRHGWTCTFLGERALQREGAGAFLAVTRANDHRDAGIVHLSYTPRTKAKAHIALVGKGICFDTGGINLKTHKSMYHMHADMQGSAVAVGTLLALTQLRAPVKIDCWLALTENEIGPRAFRPQEVVTAANGVTIQVVHSDAEGRMVLADTLALATRKAPDLVIDFATLTGACVTALTDRYSGIFTNRPQLRENFEQAGIASGERVWSFPMDEDFDQELESRIADVLQCTPDSKGDHILAARFLSRFVPPEVPWLHVDLAAAERSGGLAHIPTDFTGFGVRYATELLRSESLYRALRLS